MLCNYKGGGLLAHDDNNDNDDDFINSFNILALCPQGEWLTHEHEHIIFVHFCTIFIIT